SSSVSRSLLACATSACMDSVGIVRAQLLAIFIGVTVISCSTSVETATVSHPLYQYALRYPTEDVHAGEIRSLTWMATRAGATTQQPPPLRLCFALIGAYPSVQELKASNQTRARPNCPISAANAVFASDA